MDSMDVTRDPDTIDALLSDLAVHDVRLRVEDGRLGYDAPPGAFTDTLKARVRALRPALLAHLSGAGPVTAPLSSGQERMWFLNRLEIAGGIPGGGYTEHMAYALAGPLDRRALEGAVAAVVARHGALRCRFRDGADGPEQVIAPPGPVSLPMVDLTADPARLDAEMAAAAGRPIDLATDDHVGFTLFALEPERHILSVSAHHAAWDGWSNGVFADDLAAAYNALAAGRPPATAPLARDIADVARAQRRGMAAGAFDAPLERVRRLLDGFPTRLDLPTDRPRPAVADGRGAALPVRVPPAVTAALTAAGRRAGATPYMTVLAAFALLLSRRAGAGRLLVGAPVAARADAGEEAIIGYLSNTVAIPVDVGAAASFAALVAQVRDTLLVVMAVQRVPFEKVVETLAPPRSRATTPLVQAVFAMQPRTTPAPALDGLSVTVLPHHNEAARYEVMLNLEATADGGLEGPLTCAAALFDPATMAGLADDFLSLLAAAPRMWDAPLTAVDEDGFATVTERAVAAVWAEFLQTPPTGREDDFFVLGGHSLLLMRVVNRINDSGLGRVALADALGATTVAAMATLIDGNPPAAPVIDTADTGDHPATAAQEGMWLTRRDDPDSVTWAVPVLIPLDRHAEPDTVRIALERLAARHPALRTTLAERDGTIVQRVAAPGPVALTVHRRLDSGERAAVMRQELARPLDLEHGPLYRFHLFIGGEQDALFLVADHTMIDGWSLDVLRRDVLALLDEAATGDAAALPVLATTPAAIAASRQAMLAGAAGAALGRYWNESLDGLELGDLPAPGRRPTGETARGRRTMTDASPLAVAALDRIAQNAGTTPTVVLVAAVAALLARLKGDGRDVSVAAPFAGRPEAELAELVGCFVEVLPLRFSGRLDLPFSTHLAAARRALLGGLAHQEYPLRRLMADRMRARGGDPQPLFDAVVVLEDAAPEAREWFDPRLGAGKYDLSFVVSRLPGGGALLTVEHDEWLYDADDARDLAARLETLLIDAAARPDAALGDLALLPAGEWRRVTEDFNRTAHPYPRDAAMDTLWRQAVERHGARTALIAADGSRTTYAALDRWADGIAAGLSAAGPAAPTVALALERGPAAVAAILAVWKLGAAYLPLDAKMPPALVERLIADAGARVILADAPEAERLGGVAGATVLRHDALPPAGGAPVAAEPRNGGSPAYVMFTSGTTGTPKGVVVPHRAIARLVLDDGTLRLAPGAVIAQGAPLAFDASTLEIWAALLNGAALRILADEDLHEPAALGATLARDGVSALWLTAGLFNRMADEAPAALAPLRWVATGGEVVSAPHLRRVIDACPGLVVRNGYGPTENTCFTTLHTVMPADLDGAVPIGRPIANTRVYILDDRLHPVPVGTWGELVCGGDGVALGYAGRPDLTAAAFVTLPWGSGERVYRSGDIARWRRDGVIEFLGRRDGQVKIRGHRIETAAIETLLAGCEGVRDAAVVVTGQGVDKVLVACVAADAGNDPRREGGWRRRLAERLPLYMMPARFVVVPVLPVNANGKRDRRALETLAARTATPGAPVSGTAPMVGAAPESQAEHLVARLFVELFPGTVIDRNADFFHLGGHSLLAMRLSGRLEEETGSRIPLRALFAARSVAAIAALLPSSAPVCAQPVIAPQPAAADYPLSGGQERLWVMQRLFPDSAVYNVPLAFDADGPLDTGAMGRALVELAERHHALRLVVVDGEGRGLRQRLAPASGLAPAVIDLSGDPEPVAAADARTAGETARPFRLDREAGARAFLMKLGPGRWRVLLVLHHALCDGWSVGVLLRDLATLYARAVGGAAALPPAPPLQFQDIAVWQRGFIDGAEGKALLARWTARLTPLPEPLDLPTDHRRPPVRSFRGAVDEFTFSAERSAGLERLARAESATPFALVTALVQALLFRLTGQDDIALGTLVAGRDRAETRDTVGFLVNTLVLRQTVAPATAFRRHLADTKATCLAAVADQHCPFETLVETTGAPRDLGRNPLFDVLVVWQSDDGTPPTLPGLTTRPVPVAFPFAKFDLAFHFARRGDGIICQIEHSTDLFTSETVADLFARLDTLAAAATADPDRPLSSLPILPDGERALVVEGFNATRLDLDTRRSLVRPFLDQTAATPAAPALVWDGGSLDYRRFAARAGAVARRLTDAGVRPGDTVAVCGPRSPDLVAAIFGILMGGAAYVPLGADQPAARIAAMLEDASHPVVLAAPEARALLAQAGARRVLDLTGGGDGEPADRGRAEDLAYVMFTSGSTGRPKGVAVEQHSVLNRILWMQGVLPIGPGDVIMQKTPVTFDVSVPELFWWSFTGATVALPPPGVERDPTAVAAFIEHHGVTHVHFVPSMLAAFLACLEDGRVDAARMPRLRHVFASGEALDPAFAARFDRLLHRPHGVCLHNLYGPTEAAVEVTWHPCSPWNGGEVMPIGRPVANTSVYVLDGNGTPTPIGVAGEIHLGGPQVARGYVNRPELTREAFIPDPFAGHGRLYRTGDRGRWRRDGTVEYLGRIDHQVKVRGQRIEPGEIEKALEAHPAVERAVVVPVTVEGLTELHGYLLPRGPVTAAHLRAHLRDRVTEAMIPARFFRVDSLPLTASGKLDRKALAGVPLDAAAPPAAAMTMGAVESEIRAIWKTVLPDAEPGPRDGFFESGGNSLLVVRLHERLNRRWPGVFTVTDLFARATIAEQARRVAGDTVGEALPPPAPAPVPAPPPAGQEEGKAREDIPAGAIAIVGMAVRLPGADDLAGFWRDVAAGADRVRPLPAGREADARTLAAVLGQPAPERFREGGYLDDALGFDPRRFRMSPADAALLDPEQRLFLDVALRALEDAGRGGAALDGARVGVFVGGAATGAWREALMRGAEPGRAEQISTLNVPSNIATRLSYLHDWRGPAAVLDTACSASLAAVHHAGRALRAGECDWAVAGGAKLMLIPSPAGERMTIDSSTGRTRAFAEGADGTGVGEGAVAFLLRPLAAALADGDTIHAVIRGSAVNQDGASSGMAAPNPAAQAEVIRAAARDAGVCLSTLSYIEAHGTGTTLGDPVEIAGLTQAIGQAQAIGKADAAEPALIGSGKGNYGHLDGAAGALGLARAVACLTHDRSPPQPFFTQPNPRIDFARAPVAVSRRLTPLADRGTPRRAGVSAFGLSGINAHVILEAAPPVTRREHARGWVAVGLSAPDPDSLRAYAGAVVEALRAHPEWPLADIARTLADGRDGLDTRLAVWVRDRGDLMARLAVFAAAPDAAAGLVLAGTAPAGSSPGGGNGEAHNAAPESGTEDAARTAASAFAAGSRLSWPDALGGGRVHLPAAPLARRRCAPRLTPAPENRRADPLGPAVVTSQGRFHSLDVHDPRFWPAAEHRVRGEPTLVGMGFPALLAAVSPGPLRVRGLRWHRPLRPADLEPGTVTLRIDALESGGDGGVRLEGRTARGRWLTFASATIENAAADPTERETLDMDALCAHHAPPVTAPPFTGGGGVVTVSPRWDCLERVAAGPDGALAWLRTPAGDGGPLSVLHPGVLDAATGLALDRPGLVPTECDTLHILAPLPHEPVVHVTRRPDADGGITADVRLADRDSGQVAVILRGLRFTPLGGPPEETAAVPPGIVPSLPVWRRHPLDAADPGGPVVVIGEGPLADRMAAHLASAGRLAARCGSAAIDAAALAHLADPAPPAIVLALDGGEDIGPRAAAALREVMAALRGPTRLLGVGRGAFAVEDGGPLDPDQALVYGTVAAAALEELLLTARYVDTDDVTGPAALLAELAVAGPFPHAVAWRGGLRLLRTFAPLAAADGGGAPPWPTHGCCVVTGGSGGLSLMLAETLSNGGRVALALVSRSGTPTGDHPDAIARREWLAALRAAGLRLDTFACDTADRDALTATLARIRDTLGPITAVVHNAGVADGTPLLGGERAAAIYAQALAAKIAGVRLLDELTRDDPVCAFVMAGSLTALVGAIGHAAYTGANAFLDAFAVHRRRTGKPALTIDWCGLGAMGMAVRAIGSRHLGVTAGPSDVGPLLHRALSADAPQVALLDPPIAALLTDPPAAGAPAAPPGAAPPEQPGDAGLPLETALAGLWAAVLGYDTVAPNDDFYALGGDSIAGMQIVERAARTLGRAMTLSDLFEAGTVAALADRLRERLQDGPAAADGPQPAPHRDRYPLAWEQAAVLDAEAASAMATAHNLPHGLHLPADVDMARLRATVDALVARHEILRTRLLPPEAPGGEAAMAVQPPAPAVIEALEYPDDTAVEAALAAWVRPFDLWAAGGPVRLALVSVAGRPRLLLLDIHHALADAFTMEVLLAEIAALYAGTAGPAPALHLKDYAWWSRKAGGAAVPDAARAYWQNRFAGALPRFDLPADRPRPAVRSWRAGCVEFPIPWDTVRAVRAAAADWRTTPFAVTAAAWALLLTREADREEVVMAVPVNARRHPGMTAMTGMLVSLLPLRLAVPADDRVSALIQRVHATHGDALRHQDYGLGRLLTDLAPPPSPNRPLLAEVQLSYINFAGGGGQAPGGDGFAPFGLLRPEGKSDIGIYVRDLPDHMVMAVEYYTALFDRPRIERLGRRLCALLHALATADADRAVGDLMLDESVR